MNKILLFILAFLLQSLPLYATNHSFTRLPVTTSGWTDFQTMTQSGYESARVIFVSSSTGNNATAQVYGISNVTFDSNGMFQANGTVNAYQTIAAGYAQMRNGYPDILLLKRGDEWAETFSVTSAGDWGKSGPTSAARIILASYGTGTRPKLLLASDRDGINSGSASNLVVTGIHFYAPSGMTRKGFDILGAASDQLYEDCEFEFVYGRVQGYPEGTWLNRIAFRRNVFNNMPGTGGSATIAMTGYGINTICVEENLFWLSDELLNRRIFYWETGSFTQSGAVARGNIFFRVDGSIHMRSGGALDNNLMSQVNDVLTGGFGGNGGTIHRADVTNNVFSGARIGGTNQGLIVINNDGSVIRSNIFTGSGDAATGGTALSIAGTEGVYVLRNTEISDNIIYKWSPGAGGGVGIRLDDLLNDTQNVSIHDNAIQMPTGSERVLSHNPPFSGFNYYNNKYYSSATASLWLRARTGSTDVAGWMTASGETGAQAIQVAYPAPERSIGTYNASLGGVATTEAFMAEALKQSRHNWRSEYTASAVNDYIRDGFGVESTNPLPASKRKHIRIKADGKFFRVVQ